MSAQGKWQALQRNKNETFNNRSIACQRLNKFIDFFHLVLLPAGFIFYWHLIDCFPFLFIVSSVGDVVSFFSYFFLIVYVVFRKKLPRTTCVYSFPNNNEPTRTTRTIANGRPILLFILLLLLLYSVLWWIHINCTVYSTQLL